MKKWGAQATKKGIDGGRMSRDKFRSGENSDEAGSEPGISVLLAGVSTRPPSSALHHFNSDLKGRGWGEEGRRSGGKRKGGGGPEDLKDGTARSLRAAPAHAFYSSSSSF